MQKANTSLIDNALIWLGASISLAEILTGTLLAPLGFGRAMIAVIIGHVIGCIPLYLVGLIGARRGSRAMDSTGLAFGRGGSKLFASLNVLQLVGWTAVMVVSGAAAAAAVVPALGQWAWCLVIGGLILVWVALGLRGASRLNSAACLLLFVLTVVLSVAIFGQAGAPAAPAADMLTFGAAVELSAAMPLSWLPLIADYTSEARQPVHANRIGVAAYFLGSCWMFAVGIGAASFAGTSDIAQIVLSTGSGVIGLLIVLFSTVTTTFLDVHSAGVSIKSMLGKVDVRIAALAACVVGTLLAIFVPIEGYEDFLYLIGSVFAPMAAILIVETLVFKVDRSGKRFDIASLLLWAVGFVFYRLMMQVDTPVGCTLPTLIAVMVLCLVVEGVRGKVVAAHGSAADEQEER